MNKQEITQQKYKMATKKPHTLSGKLSSLGLSASFLCTGLMICSGCASSPLLSQSVQDQPAIARSQSPISKYLQPGIPTFGDREADPQIQGGSDADLEIAREQFRYARSLFEEGEIDSAEKAFKQLVKARRERYETFGTKVRNFWGIADYDSMAVYDNFGDPVEEDALFMLAECQFRQRRFTKAQDTYDDLLNRYSSTRHMDRVTKQLFRIARYWLGFPNELEQSESEIQLASAENEPVNVSAGDEESKGFPLLPNLTDKTRPLYDADGRGLQALRSIWLHDATGPLADDALMLAANHNLRIKNFVEAKRLYELVRDQYPDSPHLQDAYLLGSHVTLASYEGPEYDGRPLDQSRDLKQTMLQIFPEMSSEQRKMLQQEIDELHDGDIRRLWGLVEFYQQKGIPESIALHCNLIINRYPNSQYAERARGVLQELQADAQKSGRSFWVWNSGQKPAAVQTAETPDEDRPTDPRLRTSPDDEAKKPETESILKRNIFGFLRKAEEPPQLQAPPTTTDSPGRATL